MGFTELIYFIFGVDQFHLEVAHFPANTKDAISISEILHWGILPLGIKKKTRWFRSRQYLNVGALVTSRRGLHGHLKKIARQALGENCGGYDLYRISPEEFSQVLSQIYGQNAKAIRDALELHNHA